MPSLTLQPPFMNCIPFFSRQIIFICPSPYRPLSIHLPRSTLPLPSTIYLPVHHSAFLHKLISLNTYLASSFSLSPSTPFSSTFYPLSLQPSFMNYTHFLLLRLSSTSFKISAYLLEGLLLASASDLLSTIATKLFFETILLLILYLIIKFVGFIFSVSPYSF